MFVSDATEPALMSAEGNENIGEIEAKGNALKVGEGVSKVKGVKEGDVP